MIQAQEVAVPHYGAEVISFSHPPLAYISSLALDLSTSSSNDGLHGNIKGNFNKANATSFQFYFLADKSAPNVFVANVDKSAFTFLSFLFPFFSSLISIFLFLYSIF